MSAQPVKLLLAALADAGIAAFDGEPTVTPSGPYVSVWDDTGLRAPDCYGGTARNNTVTFRLMCVSRVHEALRDLVGDVTDALTGRRLAGRESSPLTESYAAPELSGGPTGDVRHTKTLVYAATFPRSTP